MSPCRLALAPLEAVCRALHGIEIVAMNREQQFVARLASAADGIADEFAFERRIAVDQDA